MSLIISPINIPAGDRRPIAVTLPAPRPSTESVVPELFRSEDGKLWRLAGTDDNGRLFVPSNLDPAKVKRWVWAKEADLVAAVGALTPVGGAA